MRFRIGCAALVYSLTTWLWLPAAVGQNQVFPNMSASDGISVYGTGELASKPNWVEIDLTVSGKAELTGDALVKYRDAKKRVQEALERLALPELTTEEIGLSISAGSSLEQQQRAMNGMPQAPTKTQIEVSSVLRVRMKGIRDTSPDDLLKTVGKLLDVAQDSGVAVGPSAAEMMQAMRYGNQHGSTTVPVRFVVADLSELREKAYELAVADARSRATRLAKLNAVKLGTALSVQEILVAGDPPLAQAMQHSVGASAQEATEQPRVSSSSLSGIPVQVRLLVRFAIQPLDPATAQK